MENLALENAQLRERIAFVEGHLELLRQGLNEMGFPVVINEHMLLVPRDVNPNDTQEEAALRAIRSYFDIPFSPQVLAGVRVGLASETLLGLERAEANIGGGHPQPYLYLGARAGKTEVAHWIVAAENQVGRLGAMVSLEESKAMMKIRQVFLYARYADDDGAQFRLANNLPDGIPRVNYNLTVGAVMRRTAVTYSSDLAAVVAAIAKANPSTLMRAICPIVAKVAMEVGPGIPTTARITGTHALVMGHAQQIYQNAHLAMQAAVAFQGLPAVRAMAMADAGGVRPQARAPQPAPRAPVPAPKAPAGAAQGAPRAPRKRGGGRGHGGYQAGPKGFAPAGPADALD